MAQQFLPISAGAIRPSLGAFVASAWLILVAVNLALGGHFDIAVRDGVLAISAYALARFEQARAPAFRRPRRPAAGASSPRRSCAPLPRSITNRCGRPFSNAASGHAEALDRPHRLDA